MKEQDVPQDPYADGITNPIRAGRSAADETPIDIGIVQPFPPQEIAPSTIGAVAATTVSGGPIGSASSTCGDLSEV
jgi:hypothetical protein